MINVNWQPAFRRCIDPAGSSSSPARSRSPPHLSSPIARAYVLIRSLLELLRILRSPTQASPSTSRMLLERCKRTCRWKKRRGIAVGEWLCFSLVVFYALAFLATSITMLEEMP